MYCYESMWMCCIVIDFPLKKIRFVTVFCVDVGRRMSVTAQRQATVETVIYSVKMIARVDII